MEIFQENNMQKETFKTQIALAQSYFLSQQEQKATDLILEIISVTKQKNLFFFRKDCP